MKIFSIRLHWVLWFNIFSMMFAIVFRKCFMLKPTIKLNNDLWEKIKKCSAARGYSFPRGVR